MSECERCGITQEDYGDIDWESYGGQDLCEQCYEETKEEERFVNQSTEIKE